MQTAVQIIEVARARIAERVLTINFEPFKIDKTTVYEAKEPLSWAKKLTDTHKCTTNQSYTAVFIRMELLPFYHRNKF